MKLLLSDCLNLLDNIIFIKYNNDIDIRYILNFVRKYIILFEEEHRKKHNKKNFLIILKYINYLIQESFHSFTINFINHMIILRVLVVKYLENDLDIDDTEDINFDKKPKLLIK